jgi:eukaryotic-like serine/threonine-protein kinase
MTANSMLDTRLAAADLQVIDAICDRFEADHRAGRQAHLASYLSEASPAGKAVLFRELLNLELEFRQENGEQPDARTYHQEFPELVGVIDAAFQLRQDRSTMAQGAGSNDCYGGTTVAASDPLTAAKETAPWAELTFLTRQEPGFPGYQILGELGRGGMGIVLRARQVALNRPVAIKLIKSGAFATENERLRFQNEAEAVAQLDHPHIVPIYEVGQHLGRHFFSMKLIEGSGLNKRLDAFVGDPRAAARVVAIIAEAVHHAHQRGILHRDLKPANILVDAQGQPYVTDLGLAKQIKGDGELTESGAPMGTPAYMSPEQAAVMRIAPSARSVPITPVTSWPLPTRETSFAIKES